MRTTFKPVNSATYRELLVYIFLDVVKKPTLKAWSSGSENGHEGTLTYILKSIDTDPFDLAPSILELRKSFDDLTEKP